MTSLTSVKKVIIETNSNPFDDPFASIDLVTYHKVFVDKLVKIGLFLCIIVILILIVLFPIIYILFIVIVINNNITSNFKQVTTDCTLCVILRLLLLTLCFLYNIFIMFACLPLGCNTLCDCKCKKKSIKGCDLLAIKTSS